MKPTYILDGSRFSTLEGFYAEVGAVLMPGQAWGKNLDAFNDILRGGFWTPAEGFVLRWENSALSRQALGYAQTAVQLRRQLEACHPSNRESLAARLRDAESGVGATVFDWLVEIIRDHGAGGGQADDGIELDLA